MSFGVFLLSFFVLIFIGMPITIAMIILSFVYLSIHGLPVEMMVSNITHNSS